jgi:hypothetical protein
MIIWIAIIGGVLICASLLWLVLAMVAGVATGGSVPLWMLVLIGFVSVAVCCPLIPLLRPEADKSDGQT